jgi:tight adherence protein C
MTLALVAFLTIFVLIGSAGILVIARGGARSRLYAVLDPVGTGEGWVKWLRPRRASESLRAAIQPFDRVLPKSPQEVSVVQKRLIHGGYRDDAHMRIFYGTKVLVPAVLAGAVAVSGTGQSFSPFIAYAMALGLGYLAPDFWLGRQIKRRQTEIRLSLPDFLDLMVVCIEAGLSIDQALQRTSDELRPAHPDISDEVGLVILEQRAGRPRADAWRNLAERVNIAHIRTLVGALLQADQFGTSVAKTLRIYSDSMRVKRRQEVEERAAKTAVKLVFPLVFCIFPALFVVALGPSILVMADAIDKFLK